MAGGDGLNPERTRSRDSSGGADTVRQIEVGAVTIRHVGNELLERAGALAALDDSLEAVIAGGSGRVVLVQGEAGVGRPRSCGGSATSGVWRVSFGAGVIRCLRLAPWGRLSISGRRSAARLGGRRRAVCCRIGR